MTISHEPFNPAGKSMLTDPTEQAGLPGLHDYEGGFTQAWDTAGAGANSHA